MHSRNLALLKNVYRAWQREIVQDTLNQRSDKISRFIVLGIEWISESLNRSLRFDGWARYFDEIRTISGSSVNYQIEKFYVKMLRMSMVVYKRSEYADFP